MGLVRDDPNATFVCPLQNALELGPRVDGTGRIHRRTEDEPGGPGVTASIEIGCTDLETPLEITRDQNRDCPRQPHQTRVQLRRWRGHEHAVTRLEEREAGREHGLPGSGRDHHVVGVDRAPSRKQGEVPCCGGTKIEEPGRIYLFEGTRLHRFRRSL